jgi:PmbA protein
MSNINPAFYEQLSTEVLTKAKQQGATHAEVSIKIETGFAVSSRLGHAETIEYNQDKGLAIMVYMGKQTGSASTTDLSEEAIDIVVRKACDIARFTSSDTYSGPPDKALMAFDYPDLELDHPWEITPQTALDFAIECENLAMNDKQITNSEGASVNSHRAYQLYANTHDFIGSYFSTQHSLHCTLIAQDSNQMHRDYDYTVARKAGSLKRIEDLAKSVKNKTLSRLGARRLSTRSAPVIFSAEMARGLLGNLVSAMSGSNIYRKSSFLIDRLDSQIFPENISLWQDPHLIGGLASAPFDNEGVRTLKQNYIEQGVLKSFVLSSYSARKLGMASTGNAGGVYNLRISNSNHCLDELLKQMGKGLLVTELIGQGINLVTGDYSRGAFGFWVENGEIQHPVDEITIAGNLKDMFLNIVAIGNDIDTRSRIQTGSILIENMVIAGE